MLNNYKVIKNNDKHHGGQQAGHHRQSEQNPRVVVLTPMKDFIS